MNGTLCNQLQQKQMTEVSFCMLNKFYYYAPQSHNISKIKSKKVDNILSVLFYELKRIFLRNNY